MAQFIIRNTVTALQNLTLGRGEPIAAGYFRCGGHIGRIDLVQKTLDQLTTYIQQYVLLGIFIGGLRSKVFNEIEHCLQSWSHLVHLPDHPATGSKPQARIVSQPVERALHFRHADETRGRMQPCDVVGTTAAQGAVHEYASWRRGVSASIGHDSITVEVQETPV